MKLFFAVFFCVLAVGFISFMTLSLNQVAVHHPEAFLRPATNSAAATSH